MKSDALQVMAFDTPVNSVIHKKTSTGDPTPTESDLEYDSHFSSDPDDSDATIPTDDDGATTRNNTDGSAVSIGQAIAYSFPVEMEYDINYDDRHMFDDGLSDDETDSSDLSSNYEELTEPEVISRVVQVPSGDLDREFPEIETDNSMDEIYELSEEDSTDEIGAGMQVPGNVESGLNLPVNGTEPEALPTVTAPSPKSLQELQRADLRFQQSVEWREGRSWKLLELQEALRQIEFEISREEEMLEDANELENHEASEMEADIRTAGLSPELFQTYKSFCKDLHPEYGLREGFSITCDQPHHDTYVTYDPDLEIFKDCVEMNYHGYNFRCEAKTATAYYNKATEYIVEFWPIESPEQENGEESTWKELYPRLYQLAIEAACNGSEAAMEMLIKLPELDSKCTGWLFEYEYEKLLESESMISRRWQFRSAHCIDSPISVQDKRKILERLVLHKQGSLAKITVT